MSSERIPAVLDGERVDRVVSMLFGVPRRQAAALVASGGVRISGEPVELRSRRVTVGDELSVELTAATEPDRPGPDPSVGFEVVYADDAVIVVDKPAGLVVHPGAGHRSATLVNGLLAQFPEIARVGDADRPGIVHRLDVGTSGLMVVARSPDAYTCLVAQLGSRTVQRRYLALVWGRFETDSGVVDAPIGRSPRNPTQMAVTADGRFARTRFQVSEQFSSPAPVSLLECRLETGRTHQIRVHLSAIGHPVVGDARYGGSRRALVAPRPFLHAHWLCFDHPTTGAEASFGSSLPPVLKEIRELLA